MGALSPGFRAADAGRASRAAAAVARARRIMAEILRERTVQTGSSIPAFAFVQEGSIVVQAHREDSGIGPGGSGAGDGETAPDVEAVVACGPEAAAEDGGGG